MLLSTSSSLSSKKQANQHKKKSVKREMSGPRCPHPAARNQEDCTASQAAWRRRAGDAWPKWHLDLGLGSTVARPTSRVAVQLPSQQPLLLGWLVKGAGQQEGPPLPFIGPLSFLVTFRCVLPMTTDRSTHRTRALLAQDLLKNLL